MDVPFEAFVEQTTWVVDPKQTPVRLDKYLHGRLANLSRNRIQQAIQHELVLVNEVASKVSYLVRPQDILTLHLPQCAPKTPVLPEPLPLDIVYEDEHLLVINKSADVVVHPAHGNRHGTLLQGVLHHLKAHPITPHLVHRIDKDTTGLLVVAKTEETQAALAKQFFSHTIHRQYLALVWGIPPLVGTINAPLTRHPKDRRVVTVAKPDQGKTAITMYSLIAQWKEVSLVACVLQTGRTHQVRAHLKYIGHPIVGDERYGGRYIRQGIITTKYKQFIHNVFDILPRQALHATALGFKHEAIGKEMCFYAPMAEDMRAVIAKWERKV